MDAARIVAAISPMASHAVIHLPYTDTGHRVQQARDIACGNTGHRVQESVRKIEDTEVWTAETLETPFLRKERNS